MKYEINKCWSCGGKYEFLSQEIGRSWNCPHCDSLVVLTPTPWHLKLFTFQRKEKPIKPKLPALPIETPIPKAATVIYSLSYIKMKKDRDESVKQIALMILGAALVFFFLELIHQPSRSQIYTPPPAPSQARIDDRSLPNGQIIYSLNLPGDGNLTVVNGTASDAVIKLVSSRGYYLFYVKANNSFQLPSVLDGYYSVKYESGNDWDGNGFTRNLICNQFDEPLNFVTTRTASNGGAYVQSTEFTLTLHKIKDGNATTTPISVADFMK